MNKWTKLSIPLGSHSHTLFETQIWVHDPPCSRELVIDPNSAMPSGAALLNHTSRHLVTQNCHFRTKGSTSRHMQSDICEAVQCGEPHPFRWSPSRPPDSFGRWSHPMLFGHHDYQLTIDANYVSLIVHIVMLDVWRWILAWLHVIQEIMNCTHHHIGDIPECGNPKFDTKQSGHHQPNIHLYLYIEVSFFDWTWF